MITRNLLQAAEESLRSFRVTVINGPRQSGKTTLARELVASTGTYRSFDDETVRAAAALDPHRFVRSGTRPLALDEIQRGGDPVVLAVKDVVDGSNERGQFVLAGSTRFLSVPQLSESLAGRSEILDLWTLSQGEFLDIRESFLDVLFDDPSALETRSFESVSREELFRRIARGGYPELVDANPDVVIRWHRNYVRTVVERDILEASSITQASEMPTLLRLIAANSSGELVVSRLAGDSRLSGDVASRYVTLLELVGLIIRIPAWTPSLTSREKRHQKVVISDSGLACSLLGRNAQGLDSPMNSLAGPMLESFIATELIKQRGWSKYQPAIKHWRDRNGAEVDLVIEEAGGAVAGIEVKASSSIAASDAKHLHTLRDRMGTQFAAGVLLYLGERIVPLGERVWALPVSILWSE